MKFAFDISLKNIRRKPFRAAATAVLVMLLSFTLFAGGFTVISLQNGLSSYQARLGADIVVIPSSAKGHGTVDDILLQGITGNYYISEKDLEKLSNIEGIEISAKQFFLTSAKASCCSSRVQIIGFDPDTDFSVMPWIKESYSGTVSDGDIVVGADINIPSDKTVKFYGQDYHVAAQLGKTGTGLDNAVYTNMNTIHQMAENAADILASETFKGVNIRTAASAVLIKVSDGYEISDITDDINIHITKVEAVSARSMLSDISEGLGSVSGIIGFLVGIVWLLAVMILITVYCLLANERKKEFAVLRIMGASGKMLFLIMQAEAFIISLIGSGTGLIIGLLTAFPFADIIRSALGLPFLTPDVTLTTMTGLAAVIFSVMAGQMTALWSAARITKNETGLLLREDV